MSPNFLSRRLKQTPWVYRIWQSAQRRVAPWYSRPPSSNQLRKHAIQAKQISDPSYAGEAACLGRILTACHIDHGYVVDLGAGDGVTQSSTLFLFRDPHWRGLAVEMEPHRFALLEAAYGQFEGATVCRHKVTPISIVPLLQQQGVPSNFDVLNLDLDSYDLAVMQAVLQMYRPGIVTMEINEKVPPPVYFTVCFDAEHVWAEDHFYGCSLTAAAELLKPAGYRLCTLEYNNAFFVRDDLAAAGLTDLPVALAYELGYRSRSDRRELFPWNHDLENLQSLPPIEVVQQLQKRFGNYQGKFIVRVGSDAAWA